VKKQSKKGFLALGLICATIALTSCDAIYARPTDTLQETELVNDSNIEHNTLSWLYDTLHDSSTTASTVKDALIQILAEDQFGKYSLNSDGEVEIEGYDTEADGSSKLEFVKNHKAYWDKAQSSDSNKYDYVEPTAITDTIKMRIDIFKNLVKKQVITSVWGEANTSTNIEDNYFYEVRYARVLAMKSKISGFEDNPTSIFDEKYDGESSTIFSNKLLLDSTVTNDDITSIVGTNNTEGKPFIHIGLYNDYINNNILPTIMSNLLVEQYVYDNQYASIARTQSRKVNYIKIESDSKTISSARSLVKQFVSDYITNESASLNKDIDYEVLASAWKGVYSDVYNSTTNTYTDAGKLLNDSGFKVYDIDSENKPLNNGTEIKQYADNQKHPYYQNTKFGDLIEDFGKITLNPKTNDTSTESTFTNSGAYSIEKGLNIKTNAIRVNDYTTHSWGTKDSGFSGLPSDAKTRLFDYTVMSDFNSPSTIGSDSYITSINGHYFLKRSISQSDEPLDSIIIKDSSSFYIVEIEEAISPAKLTIGGENAYSNTTSDGMKLETISRDIGYTVASGSTYTTTAFTHYLKNCNITYHDQSVYDYFKTTYPDLFED